MKKTLKYSFLLTIGLLMAFSSCNRLDILGMVVNRSDTEERVADWLDWKIMFPTTTHSILVPTRTIPSVTVSCHKVRTIACINISLPCATIPMPSSLFTPATW